MNTDDLFRYGVTPKAGEDAGRRFRVVNISPDEILVTDWDHDAPNISLKHGTYDIYREPKTLFEDDSIAPTWGNLKKAVEKAGLGDDTLLVVPRLMGYHRATLSIDRLFDITRKEAAYIIVE